MGHSLLIVLIVFIVFKPVPSFVCLTIDFWFKLILNIFFTSLSLLEWFCDPKEKSANSREESLWINTTFILNVPNSLGRLVIYGNTECLKI